MWPTVRPLIYVAVFVAVLLLGVRIIIPRSDTAGLGFALVMGAFDESCSWADARAAADYEQRRMDARFAVGQKSTLIKRDGDLALFQTPYGPSWVSGVQSLNAARFLAPDIYHWPPRWAESDKHPFVNTGDVMIDGGGHIGESAATALKLGASRVITIEPDPVNAEAIRRNLEP